jgi:putative flippase GtrA
VLSRAANLYARVLVRPGVRDATSGYRVYSRRAMKLLLDVGTVCDGYGFQVEAVCIVRRLGLHVVEVPITFTERRWEASKLSRRTTFEAARRVLGMAIHDPVRRHPGLPTSERAYRRLARFARFAAVGLTGIVVNQAVLWAATDLAGIYYLFSAVVATQASTLWNFALTERWVFEAGRRGRLRRLVLFAGVNDLWLAARAPFLYLLTDVVGIHYLVSNLVVLGAATVIRFHIADSWIWRGREGPPRAEVHAYDVHGLVRIHSASPLPELERFRAVRLPEPWDLTITVDGRPFGGPRRRPHVSGSDGSLVYVEQLGRFGFGVQVRTGAVTEVRVSALVGHSPHVLYTNVVEPLIRWILVRKGHALAHCACLRLRRRGVLVTARTDTGKTTTCLRSVALPDAAFVSDDMVIVTPSGDVLSYPKPLTISAHTLRALDGTCLPLRRRLFLQVQSRLHSRSGRRAAMALARSRLPVATLNALAQIVIPPPKFDIAELVPGAVVASRTPVHYLVAIERGSTLVEPLERPEAEGILGENTEDAFGFPPYPQLRAHLSDGLARREALVRSRVVDGVSAFRVRAADRHWHDQLRVLSEGRLRASRVDETDAAVSLPDDGDPTVDLSGASRPAPQEPSASDGTGGAPA